MIEKKPPATIGGATVLRYSPIDQRHRHNGSCKHFVAGRLVGPTAGLAICQYPNDSGFYLFGCDECWNSVTDTYHDTLADALHQADFEYEGVSITWREP